MKSARFAMLKRSYGVPPLLSKVLAMFLFLAEPGWAGQVTILALGDSLTQGYGLPAQDGFVPQLKRWLMAHDSDVALINGGVSGDTSAGGAARADWSLTPEVDAMILTLGGNDLLRGIDPEHTFDNLEKILSAAQSKGVKVLLVGMQASANYGPDYKMRFDAIYPALAAAHEVQFYPDFFAGLGDGTPAELLPFFQADGIHPNAQGVARIVSDMGPAVQVLVASAALSEASVD